MKTISEIKKIGKGERYRLFVDGEFFGVYESEILARHCLKSGQEVDEEFLENLKIENGDYACFNRGLNIVEKSMKSKKMMRDYLREKGYPKQCIDRAITKLEEYGYVNDESYAENYILTYRDSKSRRKLKYDLMSKGIGEEIIEEKLDELLSEDESEKCLYFAQKFMKNRDFDLKNKTKLYNHLMSKGFGYGDIAKAWEEMKNGRD